MSEYHVVGIMSGSSLDGLDVCACVFTHNNSWEYQLIMSETLDLPIRIKNQLRAADQLPKGRIQELNRVYGEWIARKLGVWLRKHHITPQLIGIHGHTVFHDPAKPLSLQIGSGLVIARTLGIPVVDNFRMKDILNGGQGAPLVPVGEHHLLPQYNSFINLGGIANVSHHGNTINAWDIAPCNQVLNHFAQKCGHPYDKNGLLAAQGSTDHEWQKTLCQLEYFNLAPPKSLSNQWTQEVLNKAPENPQSCLATYCNFLGQQISKTLSPNTQVLVTGGGAYNQTLLKRIKEYAPRHCQILVPDERLVEFKEAMIFGFLAILRKLDQTNVFASVTGAQRDTSSGDLHIGIV